MAIKSKQILMTVSLVAAITSLIRFGFFITELCAQVIPGTALAWFLYMSILLNGVLLLSVFARQILE